MAPTYETGAVSGSGGGVLVPLNTSTTAYNFMAIVVISTANLVNIPAWLTTRHAATDAGLTLTVLTGELTPGDPDDSALIEDDGFPGSHTGACWVAWETDMSGSLYENDAVHSLEGTVVTGDTAAEVYPSVAGWPFVFAWVTGDLSGDDLTVPYFTLEFAAFAPVNTESLLLYEPDECAGFPTNYPFDLVLGAGNDFRYLVCLDLAAEPNDRPPGCLVPGRRRWWLGVAGWD